MTDAGAPTGEATERLAADLAEKRRQEMVAQKESFMTETVFSDPVGAKVNALKEAQAVGYTIVLIFLDVESAELTALRVQSRVQAGGHDVPKERIAPRYERMRKNVKRPSWAWILRSLWTIPLWIILFDQLRSLPKDEFLMEKPRILGGPRMYFHHFERQNLLSAIL